MTITIYAADPKQIVIYQPEGFAAWKRAYAEGVKLDPGNYKIANMGHIYGIPKTETIVSLVSKPEHEGAAIADETFAEGAVDQPFLETHRARTEFG